MSIQIASALTEVDEDLFIEEGDDTSYTFRELLDQVTTLEDCIITVPSDQAEALRLGLTTRKGKDNYKLAQSGLPRDSRVLSFLTVPAVDDHGKLIEGFTDVRVKLAVKRSITVRSIKKPADDF